MLQAPIPPPQSTLNFDESIAAFASELRAAWAPMERLPIWQIAERHRWMPSDTAAPGPYRQPVTPWTKEIQERLHPDDPAQIVVYEAAAQAGAKSTIGTNWILAVAGGWYPSRMLVALDTLDNARDWAKDDLDSMIALSPVLRDRIRDSKSRAKGETMLGKFFPGGRLRIIGMHSANAARRMAAKYCWLDELDGAKNNVGYEGNIVQLIIGRQTTFGPARKLFLTSTPTEEGNSEIHEWHGRGDQRLFNVPCPRCGERQPLEFEDPDNRELRRFIWDKGDPSSARYQCKPCGHEFQEDKKNIILPEGIWVPTRPDLAQDGLIRSFNLNALYAAPGMLSWATLVKESEAANAKYKATGDISDLRVNVNIRKARVFAAPGQSLDRHVLADRVDPTFVPDDSIPGAIEAMAGGTDVQHESMYAVTIGVGPGWEIWVCGANRIDRSPDDDASWTEHDLVITRRYRRQDGGVSVPRRWCVDSGDGQKMTRILEYCDPRFGMGVYAIKGVRDKAADGAIWEAKIRGNKRSEHAKGRFFIVHTTEAKNDLYSYLMASGFGPGRIHIAQSIIDRYPDFLEQLTSEQRVREKGRWVWDNPKKHANHWWDALVYALAAAHSIKLAYPERFRAPAPDAPPAQAQPNSAPPLQVPPDRRPTPGRVDRGRRGTSRSTDWLQRRRGGRY